MSLLHSLLALAVALLATWTVAVHLCMAFGWPAWVSLAPLAAGMALLHVLLRPAWPRALRESRAERGWLAALLALALAFAGLALVLDVPTADDFNFFHRALAQLSALGEPFFLRDTAFNEPGLAPISPLHVLTSWELGVAMAAHALGLDPLGAYHNGTVVVLHLLLVATYALLLRELGFGRRASLTGVLAVLLFLSIDDPRLRSFGLAYRTLWVGKAAQWAVLFPMLTLFALRYARAPGLANWTLVACACSAAIGLSGTGVFLAPGLIGCAALAGLALAPPTRGALLRAAALPLAAVHPLLIGLLLVGGVLRQPADLAAWVEGFPAEWSQNLLIALGNAFGVLRAATLALLVPALVLRGAERRFVLALSAALLLFFANPWMGDLWISLVQPGSYWRVMFLFPIPLGAGMAAAAAVESWLRRRSLREAPVEAAAAARPSAALVAATSAASATAAGLATARTSTGAATATAVPAAAALGAALATIALCALVPAPEARRMPLPFRTKAPFEWRLPRAEAEFAREAAPFLEGRSLLAGPPLSWVAALVVSDLRLEAARHKDTLHVFANAGRPDEGRRRVAAWEWARQCEPFPIGLRAATLSLEHGVDALAFPVCRRGSGGERELRALLEHAPGRWREVHRAHGYRLWLREPDAA